jgi:hypothetical protein
MAHQAAQRAHIAWLHMSEADAGLYIHKHKQAQLSC